MSKHKSVYSWEKLLVGAIDHIEAGVRNLRRAAPLETTVISTAHGESIRLPTVEEMLRIKCFLVVERNATRDYLDVAALSHRIGLPDSAIALEKMNDLYKDFAGEGGDILLSIVLRLTDPDPYDLTDVDLSEYKGIVKPWSSWAAVEEQCRGLALEVFDSPANP